jgi:hypothetical protein
MIIIITVVVVGDGGGGESDIRSESVNFVLETFLDIIHCLLFFDTQRREILDQRFRRAMSVGLKWVATSYLRWKHIFQHIRWKNSL